MADSENDQPVPRSRTSGNFTNVTASPESLWGSCAQSTWAITGTQNEFPSGEKVTMFDYVIPRFHARKAKGEVFFNPMSILRETAAHVPGQAYWIKSPTPISCSGVNRYNELRNNGNHVCNLYTVATGSSDLSPLHLPGISYLISPDELEDIYVQLSTRVRSDRGRAAQDLFEDLAEMDKSLHILSDLLRSVRKTVMLTRAKHALAGPAELWLMYRYGIRPLIQDIAGVIEGLKQRTGLVRKTSRASWSSSKNSSRVVTYSDAKVRVDIQEVNVDTISIRCMSLDEFRADLLYNIGFSFKSLLTLPWELVRFSFVVDWFANVGDFIGSLTPSPSFLQLGSCVVVRRTLNRLIAPVATVGQNGWSVIRPTGGGFSYTREEITRTPGLPDGGLVWKNSFGFQNLTRCLDASSLVIQAITGRRSRRSGTRTPTLLSETYVQTRG